MRNVFVFNKRFVNILCFILLINSFKFCFFKSNVFSYQNLVQNLKILNNQNNQNNQNENNSQNKNINSFSVFSKNNQNFNTKNITNVETSDLDKKIESIPQPAPLKDVVILDAGHGYADGGGGYKGLFEYIPNAQLIYKLANYLVDTGFFEVYITHPLEYGGSNLVFDEKLNTNHKFIHTILPKIQPNGFVGENNKPIYNSKYAATYLRVVMEKMVRHLRKTRNKIYSISVHHNCAGTTNVDRVAGMQNYYYSKHEGGRHSADSLNFIKNVFKFCGNLYGESSFGKEAMDTNFLVTQIGCPAILCEIDFIDNVKRQAIIFSDKSQTKMAKGLKNAIMATYGYEVEWANVTADIGDIDSGLKVNVKNLSNNIKNVKLAVHGNIFEDGKVVWIDLDKLNNENVWSGVLLLNDETKNRIKKLQNNAKICLDLYSYDGNKNNFIDSDFNDFEINVRQLFNLKPHIDSNLELVKVNKQIDYDLDNCVVVNKPFKMNSTKNENTAKIVSALKNSNIKM